MLDSLFEKFERIVVLDTETTGIDCKKDEIIELAAASVTPGGIESEMDVFIRLSEGRTLPPMITQLTGITPEMLTQQGVEKWEAAAQFAAAISHPNTLLVAYNAQFDLCFLYYFLARLELADALKGVKMLDAMAREEDDLLRYVNLFGYNPKYGVSGPRISSITYLPQGRFTGEKLYHQKAPALL